MIVVGFVGYVETPRGLRALTSVWAGHLSDEVKRYTESGKEKSMPMEEEINRAKNYCQVIRAICHTQISKVKIGQKKAHIKEIQINGGSTADKVDFVVKMFEQPLPVATVFNDNEMVDVIGATKGHGNNGVVTRWGVTRLARKSHRGQRKVACIGTWHPARVQWQVPRAGQRGYFHRTIINKKIYRVGKAMRDDPHNAQGENDLTEKAITPMGGFPHYGEVNEDWLMIRGTCPGPKKKVITIR